jgi:hypothetical protein
MNRRSFLKSATAALCIILIGCPAQSTIADLTSILGTSAASIASIEGNPQLAQKLQTDTAAAVVAVTNWKSGTPAQDVIEALNIVEDDLNLFPVTGAYGPLIDLAIGTVESILALLPQPVAAANVAVAHATHRQVTLTQPAPKTKAAFKSQWNAIVAGNPAMASAKIK